jgi:putative intracellular protease/amidase
MMVLQAGANYVRGLVDFRPFVTRSGQLITGQNSASALAAAQMVVEALSHGVRLTV